jgi:hypothetical protein
MASGVNATFRQIGFAVSIATLGSIFAPDVEQSLRSRLSGVPALSRRANEFATLLRQGDVGQAIRSTPPRLRGTLEAAIRGAFTSGVNDLVVLTGILALVGAAGAFVLIRRKDFVARAAPGEYSPATPQGQAIGAAAS